MSIINIPRIGDELTVSSDISVSIKSARQNSRYIDLLKKNNLCSLNNDESISFEIKKDTRLVVDRLYVRNGVSSGFDSITFKITDSNHLPKGRFFVSIEMANSMSLISSVLGKKKEVSFREFYHRLDIDREQKTSYILKNSSQCFSASLKINPRKLFDSIQSSVNSHLSKYDLTYDDAVKRVLEELETNRENDNWIEVLKNNYSTSDHEHIYSTIEQEDEYIELLDIGLNIINLKNDNFKLKNPFILTFSGSYRNTESLPKTLLCIYHYLQAMIFVCREIEFDKGNNSHDVYRILSGFESIFSKNIASYTSTWDVRFDCGNYEYMIPYERLSKINILSQSKDKNNFMLEFCDFFVGSEKCGVNEIRTQLTKSKSK